MNKLKLDLEGWKKCDVYSFAVMFYQSIADKPELWANFKDHHLVAAITSGQRPKFHEAFVKDPNWVYFAQLVTNCWDGDPTRRPSFRDLIAYQNKEKRETLNITGTINRDTHQTQRLSIGRPVRQGRPSRLTAKNKQ